MNHIEAISKKLLDDYMERRDENRQFLVQNPKIVDLVKSIKVDIKVVNIGELELN